MINIEIAIVEYSWMRTMLRDMIHHYELKLPIDLRLYAIVYALSRNDRWCMLAQGRLANELGVSRQSVVNSFRRLEKANIIIRDPIWRGEGKVYKTRAIVPAPYAGDEAIECRELIRALGRINL